MKVVIVTVFFMGLLQIGATLKCYQCYTDNNIECWNGTLKDNFDKVTCTSNSCVKVKLPSIGGIARLGRDCFREELCNKYSVCMFCDSNLCNDSSRLNSYCVLFLTIALLTITTFM